MGCIFDARFRFYNMTYEAILPEWEYRDVLWNFGIFWELTWDQRCQVRDLKQLGFFGDFYFEKSISGFFFYFLRKGSSKFRNHFFGKIDH